MAKYEGPYTVYSGAPSPDLPLPTGAFGVTQGGFTMDDLSLGYGAKLPPRSGLKSYKFRLQVNNVTNRDVILLKSAKATSGAFNPMTSTYNVLTPTGYFLTVSAEF
jgi:outer membrane receptor protein involved in Fe transport